MTAPVARPAGRDSGLFLVGQLALVFAALLWMPFGVRDAAGVSNVLPALRPAPVETPGHAFADQVEAAEPRAALPGPSAIVATVALAGWRFLRRRRPSPLRPRPVPAPVSLTVGVVGGRAPPLPG